MLIQGIPIAKGCAVGRVLVYRPWQGVGEAPLPGPSEQEQALLQKGLEGVKCELEAIRHRLVACGKAEEANILQSSLNLLADRAMLRELEAAIQKGAAASQAVGDVYGKYAAMVAAVDDPLIQERAGDLEDLRRRLLCQLAGGQVMDLSALAQPVVLAARELGPADTANLDKRHVLAIATEQGGAASHSAILARGLGIPCVSGLPGLLKSLADGDELAVHGARGQVYINPAPATKARFAEAMAADRARLTAEAGYRNLPCRTAEGKEVALSVNLKSTQDDGAQTIGYLHGVGLLRTEFLFLGRASLPDEQTQYEAYRAVLGRWGGRPIVLRTLDIGGDKPLPGLAARQEANPFLGVRGVRFTKANPHLQRTQLRAALRAAAHGNLWLLLPMVSCLEEISHVRQTLAEVEQELQSQGVAVGSYKLGVMVETPAIALLAAKVADLVDFASVGTNDLVQYTLAADRMNTEAAQYYQPYHPAVLGLVAGVAEAFARAGKPLSVCGEMAQEPAALLLFYGMGIRHFSMEAAAIPGAKRFLQGVSADAAARALKALDATTAEQAAQLLAGLVDELEV